MPRKSGCHPLCALCTIFSGLCDAVVYDFGVTREFAGWMVSLLVLGF